MAAIIIVSAAALAAGIIFDRKIHETLPMAVFAVTLVVYALALILPLNVAVWICAGISVLALIISFLMKKKTGSRLLSDRFSIPELAVFAIVIIIFCIFLSDRHVFYYDDLSYWALYTKNIFSIDKLPHLFENCSVDYKDYTPVIQVLQYIAMFGRKVFLESSMYRTNVCLIYILLLPILSEARRKPAAIAFYVIFPHILTAQFYYRLGVDLFLALTFGYALWQIFQNDKIDTVNDRIYRILCIMLSLSFLALVKTSGIVLCIIALVFFAVKELPLSRKMLGSTAFIVVFMFGSYFSWQLFLRYSWNNGYLSNRVKAGITGGGFAFPSYTGEVVVNYIKHFFAYPLTRANIGVTAFVLVLFIIITHIISIVSGCSQGCHKASSAGARALPERRGLFERLAPCGTGPAYRKIKSTLICILTGLVIFALAHLSMYLFVFDEWEAHGLMEFDRYITQYLGGAFMLYACILVKLYANTENRAPRIMIYIALAVFAILLPYGDMKTFLIPSNYRAYYEEHYAKMAADAEDEWKASKIEEQGLKQDGTGKITAVADAWDETTQFIEYTAVPQPLNRIINVPAADPGTVNGFIMENVDDYVYVFRNAPKAYRGDWDETASLTEDKKPLRAGGLYFVDRTNDDKTLRIIE